MAGWPIHAKPAASHGELGGKLPTRRATDLIKQRVVDSKRVLQIARRGRLHATTHACHGLQQHLGNQGKH